MRDDFMTCPPRWLLIDETKCHVLFPSSAKAEEIKKFCLVSDGPDVVHKHKIE